MEPFSPARPPRVSRETRRLLAIVFISLSLLWVLARLRFREEALPSIPIAPVLTQLAPRSTFDDLAFSISQLEARLLPSLFVVTLQHDAQAPGLRIRGDLAVALITNGTSHEVVARDPVSGLAVLRVADGDAPRLTPWAPRRLNAPRYLFAAEPSHAGLSVRPVFVSTLHTVASPSWRGSIWMLPPNVDLLPGAFVFAADGTLAGLAIDREGEPAIVPGSTVVEAAERLVQETHRAPASVGVTVQALTPDLASALSADAGVVVASVDPNGPARDQIAVTEIIEAAGGDPVPTLEHWRARVNRLGAGDVLDLRVRSRTGVRDVKITAVAHEPEPGTALPLGLVTRAVRGGVEVVRVLSDSAGARGGLAAGDVITLIADISAPTPLQVSRTFAAAADDRPVVVAITRANLPLVLALPKR